jgi:5'-deoxynucleotidase
MNSKNYGFLSLVLRQRLIRRWSLMRCVQDENVLEHSAIVSILVILAAEIAHQNGKVIDKALMLQHAAEVLVGDVVTPVKRANPTIHAEFKRLEEQAEHRLLQTLPDELKQTIADAFSPGGYEQALVKACDSYSAYIKCKFEVAACNKEFEDALISMEKVVTKLRQEFPEIEAIHSWFSEGLSMSIDRLLNSDESDIEPLERLKNSRV